MGLGSHHLLSDCGKMKFFLIFLLLLLLFDSPQGSSLPHIRKIRALNTTLQTNFNGTYERRNPCTNAEIESSSYVASHEFHHHTKEDNWSDYTHRCSAIISGFLQAIGNLVRFNNKQNGIFNFHINTSISQKQDGQHGKACESMPTIVIEATDCEITPRKHENEKKSKTEKAGPIREQTPQKIISKSQTTISDQTVLQGKPQPNAEHQNLEAEEKLKRAEDVFTTADPSTAVTDIDAISDPFMPLFSTTNTPGEILTTEDSSLAVPNDFSQNVQTYEPIPDVFGPPTTPLPYPGDVTPGPEKVPVSNEPSRPTLGLENQPKVSENFDEESHFYPPTRTSNVPYYTTQPSVNGFGTTSQPTVSVSNVEQINQNQYPPAMVNEQEPPVVYSKQLSNDNLNGQVPASLLGEPSSNSSPHQIPNLSPQFQREGPFEGNRRVDGALDYPEISPDGVGANLPVSPYGPQMISNEFVPPKESRPADELSFSSRPPRTQMPNPFPLQQDKQINEMQPPTPNFVEGRPTLRPDLSEFPVTIPPQVQQFSPFERQTFGPEVKPPTMEIPMSYPVPPTHPPRNYNEDAGPFTSTLPPGQVPDMTPNFENNFRTDQIQTESIAVSDKPPADIGRPLSDSLPPRQDNQFPTNLEPGLQHEHFRPNPLLTPQSFYPGEQQPATVFPSGSINPQTSAPKPGSLITSPARDLPVPNPPQSAIPPTSQSSGGTDLIVPQIRPFELEGMTPSPLENQGAPQQQQTAFVGLQPAERQLPDNVTPNPFSNQPIPNTFTHPESGNIPPPTEEPLNQFYDPQRLRPVNGAPFETISPQLIPKQQPPLDYAGQNPSQEMFRPEPENFQRTGPIDVVPPQFPLMPASSEADSQINRPVSIPNPDSSTSSPFPNNNIGNQLNELTTYKSVINPNDFQPKTESSLTEPSDPNLDYTTQTPFYDSIPIGYKSEPESQLGISTRVQDSSEERPNAPVTERPFSPPGFGNYPPALSTVRPDLLPPLAQNITAVQPYPGRTNSELPVLPPNPKMYGPPGMGYQDPLFTTPRPDLPFMPPRLPFGNAMYPSNIKQPDSISETSSQLNTNVPSLNNNPVMPDQPRPPLYPNQNGEMRQPLPPFPPQIPDQTTALPPREFPNGSPSQFPGVGPVSNVPAGAIPSVLDPTFEPQPGFQPENVKNANNGAPTLRGVEEVTRETIPPSYENERNIQGEQPFLNPGVTLSPGFSTPATFNTKPYISSESQTQISDIASEEFRLQPFTTPMPPLALQTHNFPPSDQKPETLNPVDRPQEKPQPDLVAPAPLGSSEFQSADGNRQRTQDSFNGRPFPHYPQHPMQFGRPMYGTQTGNQPFNQPGPYPENGIPSRQFYPQYLRKQNQPFFASQGEPQVLENQNPKQPTQNFVNRPNDGQTGVQPGLMNQPVDGLTPPPEYPVPLPSPEPRQNTPTDVGKVMTENQPRIVPPASEQMPNLLSSLEQQPMEPQRSQLNYPNSGYPYDQGRPVDFLTAQSPMSRNMEFLNNGMSNLTLDAGQPELQNLKTDKFPTIPSQLTSQSYGDAVTANAEYPKPYRPQPSENYYGGVPRAQTPVQIPTDESQRQNERLNHSQEKLEIVAESTPRPAFDQILTALQPQPQYVQNNAEVYSQPKPQPSFDLTEILGDKADGATLLEPQTSLPSELKPETFASQPPRQTTYTDTNTQDTINTKRQDAQPKQGDLNNFRPGLNQNFDAPIPGANYPPQDRRFFARPPYSPTDNMRPADLTSRPTNAFTAGINPTDRMINGLSYPSTDMPLSETQTVQPTPVLLDTTSPQPPENYYGEVPRAQIPTQIPAGESQRPTARVDERLNLSQEKVEMIAESTPKPPSAFDQVLTALQPPPQYYQNNAAVYPPATAVKYDEEIITGQQSSPAPNPDRFSEENIKDELQDLVTKTPPLPQQPFGFPLNQQPPLPKPPQQSSEFSDMNRYQAVVPAQPQLATGNEMNSQLDAAVRSREQNSDNFGVQSSNPPPQMFSGPQIKVQENPAFKYEQLPIKNFEERPIDNRTMTEEFSQIPFRRAQSLPEINYSNQPRNYNPMRPNQPPPNFYNRGPHAFGYPNIRPNYGQYQQFPQKNPYGENFNSNARQFPPESIGRPAPPFQPPLQPQGQGSQQLSTNTNTREIVNESVVSQDGIFKPPMQQPQQDQVPPFTATNAREIGSDTLNNPSSGFQQPPLGQLPLLPNRSTQEIKTESFVSPAPVFAPPVQQPPQGQISSMISANTTEITDIKKFINDAPVSMLPRQGQRPLFPGTDNLVGPATGFQPPMQDQPQGQQPPSSRSEFEQISSDIINSLTPVQQPPQRPALLSSNINRQEILTDTFVTPAPGFGPPMEQSSLAPPLRDSSTSEIVTDTFVSPAPVFERTVQPQRQGPPQPSFNTNAQEIVTDSLATETPVFEPPMQQRPHGPLPPFTNKNTGKILSDSLVRQDRVFEPPMQQPSHGPVPPLPNINAQGILTDTSVSPAPAFEPPIRQGPPQGLVPLLADTNTRGIMTNNQVSPAPVFEPPVQRQGQEPPQPFFKSETQEVITDDLVTPPVFEPQRQQPQESFVSPPPLFEPPMKHLPKGAFPPFPVSSTRDSVSETSVSSAPTFEPTMPNQPQAPFSSVSNINTQETVTDTFGSSTPVFESPVQSQIQRPVPPFPNTNAREIFGEMQGPPQGQISPITNTNIRKVTDITEVTDSPIGPSPVFEPPMQRPPEGQLPLFAKSNAQEIMTDSLVTPAPVFQPQMQQEPSQVPLQPFTKSNTEEIVTENAVRPLIFKPPMQTEQQGPPLPFSDTNREEIVTETFVSSAPGFQPPTPQPPQDRITPSSYRNTQEIVTETSLNGPQIQGQRHGPPPPFSNTNAQQIMTDSLVSSAPGFQPPMQSQLETPPPPFSNTNRQEIMTDTFVSPAPVFEPPIRRGPQSLVPPFTGSNTREIVTDSLVSPAPALEPPMQPRRQGPSQPFFNTQEVVTDQLVTTTPVFEPPMQKRQQDPLPPFSNTRTQEVVTETLVSPSPVFGPDRQTERPFPNINRQESITDTFVSAAAGSLPMQQGPPPGPENIVRDIPVPPRPILEPPMQQLPQSQVQPSTSTITRETVTDSLLNSQSAYDKTAGSAKFSNDAQNSYSGQKVTKLVEETITTDLPLGMTNSPVQNQLAYADKLLNQNLPVGGSSIMSTPSPQGKYVETFMKTPSAQIPFNNDKRFIEGQSFGPRTTSEYVENTRAVGTTPVGQNMPIRPEQIQGTLTEQTRPSSTEYDQVLPIQKPKESFTEHSEVVPSNINRQPGDGQTAFTPGYGPYDSWPVTGPPVGPDQNVPYGFPPQQPSTFTPEYNTPPPPTRQHSNPLLHTLETHLTFPLHEPPEQSTSSTGPRRTSPLPLLHDSHSQNEFRGASALPPNAGRPDFVNSQSPQPNVSTAREVTISPQPDSRVLVSDQNDPSNGPGEDYVSCCERCRRGPTPLSCPFDPICKGNMTAPSYYVLITKLPVGENEEEQFKVEKVYLGDGTPLNCSLCAGKTFPTSSYRPIPYTADGTTAQRSEDSTTCPDP